MATYEQYLGDVPTRTLHDGYTSIGIYHDEAVHEAEVSAANRFAHKYSDGEPFFPVDAVRSLYAPHENDPGDILTLVDVDTSEVMLDRSDVMLFHANLNDHIGAMRHAGMTDVQPGVSSSRYSDHETVIPKMLVRIESNRGTREEFRTGLQTWTSAWNPGDAILAQERQGGTNVGYIIGRGMTLSDVSNLDKDAFGPGGKSVTDIGFAGIPVDADDYSEFRSKHEADGG